MWEYIGIWSGWKVVVTNYIALNLFAIATLETDQGNRRNCKMLLTYWICVENGICFDQPTKKDSQEGYMKKTH